MRNLFGRILVALRIPIAVAALLEFVDFIHGKMSGNPNFPNPNPTLARIQQAADALNQAQTAKNTTKGARGARDEKKKVLRGLLKDVGMYVESTANLDPENAVAIIESSGFHVKKHTTPNKGELEVKQGKASGEVILIAKRTARFGAYEFQYSTDQKAWTSVPTTVHVKTTVSSLTPGTTYSFRFRRITRAGVGNWSQVVNFLVK